MNLNLDDVLVIPNSLFLKGFREIEAGVFILQLGLSKKCKQIRVTKKVLELFLFFQQPSMLKDAASAFQIPVATVVEICSKLFENNLLARYYEVEEKFHRYDRSLLFYNLIGLDAIEVQTQLSSLSIGILGVGGIGNWLSLSLIGLGLKEIKIFDFDDIELTNLNRQVLFKEEDIGRKKIEIAKRELSLRNTQTKVEAVDFKVPNCLNNQNQIIESFMTQLTDIDLLVVSADKPPRVIQNIVTQCCLKRNVPHIFVGYTDLEGIVGPLVISGETPCFNCLIKQSNLSQSFYTMINRFPTNIQNLADRFRAPSFVGINALVSSIAAFEIIKFLIGLHSAVKGARMVVNPFNWEINRIPLTEDPECEFCLNFSK